MFLQHVCYTIHAIVLNMNIIVMIIYDLARYSLSVNILGSLIGWGLYQKKLSKLIFLSYYIRLRYGVSGLTKLQVMSLTA